MPHNYFSHFLNPPLFFTSAIFQVWLDEHGRIVQHGLSQLKGEEQVVKTCALTRGRDGFAAAVAVFHSIGNKCSHGRVPNFAAYFYYDIKIAI
ncbi:hypothetical protein RUM43_005305 [Polyplax serrata]|uniref:Uncharacterized protein n=1 Tax=Polyplax serrata TaxID=468196 RepID=A0AAN8S8L5_POLSC